MVPSQKAAGREPENILSSLPQLLIFQSEPWTEFLLSRCLMNAWTKPLQPSHLTSMTNLLRSVQESWNDPHNYGSAASLPCTM